MIYLAIKNLFGIIKAHPMNLALYGAVFLMFGTCSGISLLNHYSFINPLSIIFYALALLVFIPALIKGLIWRKSGLLQPFADGTVLWQFEHVLSVTSRDRPLLGVRETTTRFFAQHAVFVLPETGSQNMVVTCETCQQEAVFVVDSLERRKVRRKRIALTSLVFLVLSIVLGMVISPTLSPDSLNLLWFLFILVLFCSIGGLWIAFQYPGVSRLKMPRGHRVRPFLEEAQLERYRKMGALSSEYPIPITQAVLQSQVAPKQVGGGSPGVWKIGDVILSMFEVTGTLGEGGMGRVYKVRYRAANVDLAMKSPKPEIFARADGKESFIHEAETWLNLREHPHLVTCHFVRTVDDVPHIFVDYVDGGSLAEWIRQRRLYEGGPERALERMLDVAIQFAWGLHTAHEQGLVHQDVKPANVMMAVDGTAKVTDFGLAKARAMAGEEGALEGDQSILVSSGGMTPAYCSPEQAAHQPLSRKTDIWSWGVSVLEMFVGGVEWMAGPIAREALASHQRQDEAIPEMPPEIVTLLGNCLQSRPEDRPATMLEVATDLQALYERLVGRRYPREAPKPAELLAAKHFFQGYSLSELGRREEAVAAYEQATRLDPAHVGAHNGKALLLFELGRHEEALGAFRQVTRLNPNSAHAYSLMGVLLLGLGRHEEALAAVKEAIRLDPTAAEPYQIKGRVLTQLGEQKGALAAFDQGIRLDPTSADATIHHARWTMLAESGRQKEALAALEEAIRLDPTSANTTVYFAKGLMLKQMRRREDALAAFEEAIRLDPTSADGYRGKGVALIDLGRNEEALSAFDQAISLDPTSVDAYVLKGAVLADLKRREEALTAFDEAIRVDPTSSDAYRTKALVLKQLKRQEEAKQAQQKARELEQGK
jgi:tetratricopeptide (TPR) repeat protein